MVLSERTVSVRSVRNGGIAPFLTYTVTPKHPETYVNTIYKRH